MISVPTTATVCSMMHPLLQLCVPTMTTGHASFLRPTKNAPDREAQAHKVIFTHAST
jgi:hypothetical protein